MKMGEEKREPNKHQQFPAVNGTSCFASQHLSTFLNPSTIPCHTMPYPLHPKLHGRSARVRRSLAAYGGLPLPQHGTGTGAPLKPLKSKGAVLYEQRSYSHNDISKIGR